MQWTLSFSSDTLLPAIAENYNKLHKNYSDNAMKFSNLRRKFIKKATYTAPLLLSLGSLTKPQVAGGSHLASPIQIPTGDLVRSRTDPLFTTVYQWLDTTRFWGGGLLTDRDAYGFNAREEDKYLDTHGFERIRHRLQEPQSYVELCTRERRGRCSVNPIPGYTKLRNSPRPNPEDPILTDDKELTYSEYLQTRSFEKDRTIFQAGLFSTFVRRGDFRDVRSLLGLDGANANQIRAHYELAAYNHYTREVLGHDFYSGRMSKLATYDKDHHRRRGQFILRERVVRDALGRIRDNNECQSIDAVFSQLCGAFDPYRFL